MPKARKSTLCLFSKPTGRTARPARSSKWRRGSAPRARPSVRSIRAKTRIPRPRRDRRTRSSTRSRKCRAGWGEATVSAAMTWPNPRAPNSRARSAATMTPTACAIAGGSRSATIESPRTKRVERRDHRDQRRMIDIPPVEPGCAGKVVELVTEPAITSDRDEMQEERSRGEGHRETREWRDSVHGPPRAVPCRVLDRFCSGRVRPDRQRRRGVSRRERGAAGRSWSRWPGKRASSRCG